MNTVAALGPLLTYKLEFGTLSPRCHWHIAYQQVSFQPIPATPHPSIVGTTLLRAAERESKRNEVIRVIDPTVFLQSPEQKPSR